MVDCKISDECSTQHWQNHTRRIISQSGETFGWLHKIFTTNTILSLPSKWKASEL